MDSAILPQGAGAVTTPIQILLVEDDEVFRMGLTLALKQTDKLALIGACSDGQSAVDWLNESQPDLILMDLGLPLLNGIEATRIIKKMHPAIKVLILTSSVDTAAAEKSMQAGADGFCLKGISMERLILLIQEVYSGVLWIDSFAANRIKNHFQHGLCFTQNETDLSLPKELLEMLTGRERQVLKEMSQGKDNTRIAAELGISQGTVRSHVHSILHKLNVKNRTQAAYFLRKYEDNSPHL